MEEVIPLAPLGLRPANDPWSPAALLPLTLAHLLERGDGDLADTLFGAGPPLAIGTGGEQPLYANPAWRALFGGRIPLGQARAMERVMASGNALVQGETVALADRLRHFRGHLFPLLADGRPLAVAALLQDSSGEIAALTQARRDQQRAQDIIRASSDWVWETDLHGRLSFVSDRVTALLGVPTVLLRGKPFGELGEAAALARAMEARQAFREIGFALRGEDGAARQFWLSGVPVFDESGAFLGYRGTATDITARRAAEEAAARYRGELETALHQARAAAHAKGEFLATMSHELRTPLNAIIGFSEVMATAALGPLESRYGGYARDILASGRHLLALIDDILDLARAEQNKLRLETRAEPLAPLLEEARSMVAGRAAEKRLALSVAGTALAATADRVRTLQILANLLGNAVKFTPDGGRVEVSAEAAEGRVRIAVSDSGPGVPEAQREAIFEPFRQLHETILARRHEGIGVGLTLSRQLARAMGGDVVLEGSSAAGSRFVLVLPQA